MLANKIAHHATEVFQSVGLEQKGTSIVESFQIFKDIFEKLDYLFKQQTSGPAEEETNFLLLEAWDLLKSEQEVISLTNLVTFLIALENVYVD